MLDITIRINGEIVKYVSAKNIDAKPADQESKYIVRPTNTILRHKRKLGIHQLACKMLMDLEKFEKPINDKIKKEEEK